MLTAVRKSIVFALLVTVLLVLATALAGAAYAETVPKDPPSKIEYGGDTAGQTVCNILLGPGSPGCAFIDSITTTESPSVQTPDGGVLDMFELQDPTDPPTGDPFADGSKVSIWESSGLGGFKGSTYDLLAGGKTDPEVIAAAGAAKVENGTANTFVELSTAITAFTASVSRISVDPTWLDEVVAPFAEHSTGILKNYVWLPFMALGLALASLALLWVNRSGDVGLALTGVLHAMVVVAVGLVVLQNPVWASQKLQQTTTAFGGVLGAATDESIQTVPFAPGVFPDLGLGGGAERPGEFLADPDAGPTWARPASATDAATSAIVKGVHYNGWLRRTFGTSNAGAAKEFGPRMFADQRFTWAEHLSTLNDPAARTALIKKKNEDWKAAYGDLIKKYPEAQVNVQGLTERSTMGALELGYSFVANLFRFFAAALLMLGCLVLVMCGLLAVIGAPFFVTLWGREKFHALADAAMRALVNALFAVVMSWLFSIYTMVVFSPGLPGVLSGMALILGTVIFWSVLRPDRKILSMLAPGKVDSLGWTGRKLKEMVLTAAGSAIGSRIGSKAGVEEAMEESNTRERSEDFVRPTPPPMPPASVTTAHVVHEGVVLNRGAVGPGATPTAPTSSRVVPGEVITPSDTGNIASTPPESTPGFYRRPSEDAPIADVAPSMPGRDVEIYQRPVADSDRSEDAEAKR
jgi:hypothetical protein